MATEVSSVLPPFPIFTDVDGEPLENGSIYVGQAGLNPVVDANRVVVYSDPALTIPIAQPIRTIGGHPVLAGSPTHMYVQGDDYSMLVNDRHGTLVYSSLRNPLRFGLIDYTEIKYDIAPSEIAAGLTEADLILYYYWGDVRRYGAVGDGGTDNTTAIQRALTACAGAFTVVFPPGASYYRLTDRVTAPADTHIVLEDAELRWTATTASGPNFIGVPTRPGIEVTGNNFLLEGKGVLRGPTNGAYIGNECAIYMTGTDTSNRASGFTMRGAIEVLHWGSYGVLLNFTDNILIESPEMHIHNVGYACILVSSCNHGRVRGPQLGAVSPGVGGSAEMHGFSLSSDTRNYHLDPNAGTKQAANPFCWDWIVEGCTVYDLPSWRGLDAHGAYESHFINNNIFNCGLPIGLSSSSGDATNYAGWDNSVVGNVIDARKRDGTASTITAQGAIIVNGGSTVRHQRVVVANNHIYGYGVSSNNWEVISASLVQDAIIANNNIDSWQGNGIYSTGGNGIIDGNTFGAVAVAANSKCIMLDATLSGTWTISNNKHRPIAGLTALEGLRISVGNPRMVAVGNDFNCVDPYAGNAALLTCGQSDLIPRIQVVGGAPTTIDVGPALIADRVWIELATGVTTVTDLTNAKVGTIYILINNTTNNFTFDRTNAALPGGVNAVLGQYDTLTLFCVATAGIKFVALAGPIANS